MRRSLLLLVSLLAAAGCQGSSQMVTDDLRARVIELEDENDALRRRNAELQSELSRQVEADPELEEAVRESVPHLAELRIGRLTHARDDDGDGRPDRLLVYMSPLDGRGRFIQVVGRLTANAAVLPVEGPPVAIGHRRLEPGEMRDAYRSGVTGTHYTVEIPLDLPAEVPISAIVRLAFDDGLTGRRLEATHVVELLR